MGGLRGCEGLRGWYNDGTGCVRNVCGRSRWLNRHGCRRTPPPSAHGLWRCHKIILIARENTGSMSAFCGCCMREGDIQYDNTRESNVST
ncbi:unnamed protein product [Leptosia nina]|uniref:Uncharacterized protein n=1 Tax=Leptosia nina TaxID=320188 RepID=A0AAV1K2F9_9NEOP